MELHECVSFIMFNGSEVLLEKRSGHKETDAGLITIPGGHIEYGESQTQALFREVKEELNVIPTEYKYLCSLYHPTKELRLIHYFIISRWTGDITALETDDVMWYSVAANHVGIEAVVIALKEVERVNRCL